MAYVTASDGTRLWVEEAGSGSAILFIHEFGGDHRSWEPQMRAFARRHRCIAYSARGYTPSDVPATRTPTARTTRCPTRSRCWTGWGWRGRMSSGCRWAGSRRCIWAALHPGRALSVTAAGAGTARRSSTRRISATCR